MSEPATEAKPFVCPECDESFDYKMHLGRHLKHAHGILPPPKPKASRTGRGTRTRARVTREPKRGPSISKLQRDLEKSVGALILLPFMAKGSAANLQHPGVIEVLDERKREFSASWVAVAESNATVKLWLVTLLSGGVWINAAAQTVALGYTVAFLSGTVQLHPGALMLLPDLRQFVTETQPKPSANGRPDETAE